MTDHEFIIQNRQNDIRKLALAKAPLGVNLPWCLQQIQGWQLARTKLPLWSQNDDLWFPPHLSMEQCSSQATALYKSQLCSTLLGSSHDSDAHLVDLTGGYGVDFSYMARGFSQATYVECNPQLCQIAQHNMPLLELSHFTVINAVTDSNTIQDILGNSNPSQTIIFMDPARRDSVGRKTVAIQDCTPNVVELQDQLLRHCRFLILKLSPMLDISEALSHLHGVQQVHVISSRGECKELLFVLASQPEAEVTYHCVNLETEQEDFVTPRLSAGQLSLGTPMLGLFLYEPNASILKAGVQDLLCATYSIRKLHPNSNLFVGTENIPHFPGRGFVVEQVSDFSKKGLKGILPSDHQGNLTIRNFPSTVADLRRKLKLSEGGNLYLFATTLDNGDHALIRCRKCHP